MASVSDPSAISFCEHRKQLATSNFAKQIQSEGRAHAFLTSDGGHRLIERVRRQLAISHDDAYVAVYNYLIFLLLKEEAEDWNADKLSPTGAIDEIWHMHILDTAHYGEDVRKLCPSLVEKDKTFHHNPDGVFDEDGVRKRRQQMTLRIKAIRRERELNGEKEFWTFDEADGGVAGRSINSTTRNTTSSSLQQTDRKIRLFVKTLTGKTYEFCLSPSATVLELKEAVREQLGHPVDQQRLIYAGKQLDDDERTLADYNLQDKSTIHFVEKLRGC